MTDCSLVFIMPSKRIYNLGRNNCHHGIQVKDFMFFPHTVGKAKLDGVCYLTEVIVGHTKICISKEEKSQEYFRHSRRENFAIQTQGSQY